MKTKIKLSYTNNISDSPNTFIRMCYKLCNKYNFSILSMKGFDCIDRNFEVELTSRETYCKIEYNYEKNELTCHVDSNIKSEEEAIIHFVNDGCSKVSYKAGDIIFDVYGNEYEVAEDTNIVFSTNGCRVIRPIFVKSKDGSTIKLLDVLTSAI